ncbi:hypothetical protein BDF19DRAFT_462399 [Syncephalis fuscata]|nr:hypothetical protein BDF19DRAFT_462399 [Syncephalis fuscata]
MKSIIAATVTALMLVSIAQVAPVNGMPGLSKSTSKSKPEPEPIKFMGFENNDPKSPFTIHGIHFTKPPYKVDGVHYIKGTQHSQPITLACGTYSSPSNNAFQDLMAHSPLFKSDKFSVPVPKAALHFLEIDAISYQANAH